MSVNTITQGLNQFADTTRNPSPAIWSTCPVSELLAHPEKGFHFFDDFSEFPLKGTQTTQIGFSKYKIFAGANASTIISGASQVNSVNIQGGAGLKFNQAANNDATSLAQAYPRAFITGLNTTSRRVWFEARIAATTLAANAAGFFLGLAETNLWTLSATVPFNAASASLDNSAAAIGFFKDEVTLPTTVHSSVSDRATSFTDINAAITTMTANTFVKLGFVYDPDIAGGDAIKFYVDNILDATRYTKTNITATTNLKANALGPIFAVIADTVGSSAYYLQWWRFAALYP